MNLAKFSMTIWSNESQSYTFLCWTSDHVLLGTSTDPCVALSIRSWDLHPRCMLIWRAQQAESKAVCTSLAFDLLSHMEMILGHAVNAEFRLHRKLWLASKQSHRKKTKPSKPHTQDSSECASTLIRAACTAPVTSRASGTFMSGKSQNTPIAKKKWLCKFSPVLWNFPGCWFTAQVVNKSEVFHFLFLKKNIYHWSNWTVLPSSPIFVATIHAMYLAPGSVCCCSASRLYDEACEPVLVLWYAQVYWSSTKEADGVTLE